MAILRLVDRTTTVVPIAFVPIPAEPVVALGQSPCIEHGLSLLVVANDLLSKDAPRIAGLLYEREY